MKKQLIISTVLLAITTPIITMTNTETNWTENKTELNIQTKDITENLYRAKKSLLFNGYEEDRLDYEFEDVIIIIPDIKALDLRGKDLSLDSENFENDNYYRVALRLDIQIEAEITSSYEDLILETEGTITTKSDVNRKNDPLYLKKYIGNTNEMGWEDYYDHYYNEINVDEIDNEGVNWIYSLESITEYLEKDYSFLGNDLYEVRSLVYTYRRMVSPLIVNGEITYKEENMISKSEYNKSWKISKKSNNKISVYGERFECNSSHGCNNSTQTLFGPEHLLAEDTFKLNVGLSGGAIAGIVIGSLAGVALIGGGSYLLYTDKISFKKFTKGSTN